ncbi:MAG TPA: methyltransferase domain-containing protein [Thermomicrobiales bacterium]|nr:methyltransferase domain-containing protein [Thermomicrobiales bacterium]
MTTTEQPTDTQSAGSSHRSTMFEHQTDFDQVAAEYDESLPAHVVEHYLRKRVAFIRAHTTPGKTLDVGCGTGQLAERVRDAGYDVHGLDYSQGMLDVMARIRPGIPGVAASSTDMPFEDDTFDLTYTVAVLHHVADKDAVHATLKEMVRVTKPGGRILVWDHNPRNPYWPILMKRVPQDTGAERLIPEHEVLDGLTDGGARIVQSRPLGFIPDFLPQPLLPLGRVAEGVVESVPGLNFLCAHNVVLAVKN